MTTGLDRTGTRGSAAQRRQGRWTTALAVAGAATLLGGTMGAAIAADGAELEPDKGSVTILTWETYHPQEMLDAYAAETGVEVNQITAGSVDEMFARAQASADEIDLVFFDAGNVGRYLEAGLLHPFDASLVPNVENIAAGLPWEDALSADGNLYGLPYNWGTQPLVWSIEAFPEAPTSWSVLWDPEYAGKVTMPDDSYIGVAMIALAAGVENPYDMSDEDFETVRQALADLRPNLKTLTTGYNDAEQLYATGETVVGYLQNVAVVNSLNADGEKFAYGYPVEGTPFWIDGTMLLRGGHRQEVYDFVNHTLGIPWQTEMIGATGNAGIIDYDVAEEYVDAEVLAGTELPNLTDPDFWEAMSPLVEPNRFDERIAIWNEFKVGG